MTKKIICLILAALMSLLVLASCGGNEGTPESEESTDMVNQQNNAGGSESVTYPPVSGLTITLEGDKITSSEDNPGIEIRGTTATLKAGGDYTLTGKLNDGKIIVDAPKTEIVELILKNAEITCLNNAPIYVKGCDKVKIILADGTVNTLTDGVKYELPLGEDKPNACLYSSEDIDFEGTGTLIVNGNYNNGIGSKNDIDIESGIIEVSAPNNAIKGNDSVTILGGTVRITGADDAIKSDTEDDPSKGFVSIEGGEVAITADDDAIQAYTSISITGGSVTTNVGGKSVNCDGNITLAEGILTEN